MSVILTDPRHLDSSVPDWFKRKLYQQDPRLYITWNKIKERWVINECIQHSATAPHHWHHQLCRLNPFFMCQEEDGSYMELGERIFDKIRECDVLRKYGSVENMVKVMEENDRKKDEQKKKDVHEHIQDRKKDEKRNLQRAVDLMERHDWMRPHK
jgi:hypothetical protein